MSIGEQGRAEQGENALRGRRVDGDGIGRVADGTWEI